MNETKFYHYALELSLLDGAAMKSRVEETFVPAPKSSRKRVRVSRRLAIAIALAATLLISSVAYAAVLLRNQIFKEKTNTALNETIQTVTEPVNTETREGWQPGHLILFDNVQSIRETVECPLSYGTIQLAELSYGQSAVTAVLWIHADEGRVNKVTDLTLSVNGAEPIQCRAIDAFDFYYMGHYQGSNFFYTASGNPFWPGTTFSIDGKVNDEPFTLTYTFTEEAYRTLQQSIVDTVNEHKELVAQIPDEGTKVGYHWDNHTLEEVSVSGDLMYFTIVSDEKESTKNRPYSEYDSGIWPVIDGRVGEYFSLGVVDGPYEDGVVYSTCLPYTESNRPEESLISFMSIVFRYKWASGEVTVPQNETEYEAWRKESRDLSAPYCENDWIWQFEGKGSDFTVTDLVFHNRSLNGLIGIAFRSEEPFDPGVLIDTAENAPVVSIDGVRLKHLGEIDPYENICGYVSPDHLRKGYMTVGCAIADLPETFTLTVTWHGSTVEIPLNRDDVLLAEKAEDVEPYYDAIFDY